MKLGETGRQTIHIVAGIILAFIALLYGRSTLIVLTFILLILGSILINLRLIGSKLFFIIWIEETFERKNTRFPGWGPAWYLVGVLLISVFLQDITAIVVSIYILAVGDGLSTLAGMHGKNKLPLHNKKSIEGTAAFFISCLPAYAFIGINIIPIALANALVEGYSINLEDNLTIPIACVLLFSFLGV